MSREFYLVIDRDGYLRERSPSDMTREETVRDILNGQFDSVAHVFCICPEEGICRNVTEDIARDVMNAAQDALRGAALDLVEEEIGIQAANEQREFA